jgi:hypothetical protein
MPKTTECHIHGVQPAVKVTYWRRRPGQSAMRLVIETCNACNDELHEEFENGRQVLRDLGMLAPEDDGA